MKHVLFVLGIPITAVGIITLVFSALQQYGYYNLLDGDYEKYRTLHKRMITFLVIGIIFAVIGLLSIIISL